MQVDLEELILSAGGIPANPSALPGNEQAQKMTAISGQRCLPLSKSSGPIGFVERMFLATSAWASTKCFLTWKAKATPQGRLLFQLAPSMPRTEETGFGLFPTATTFYTRENWTGEEIRARQEEVKAETLAKGKHQTGNGFGLNLAQAARLWPTPRSCSAMAATNIQNRVNDKFPNLESEVARETFPTPTASMHKGASEKALTRKNGRSRENDRLDFKMQATEGSGSLNPAWVEWLMGFPIGHTDLKPSETPLSLKSSKE